MARLALPPFFFRALVWRVLLASLVPSRRSDGVRVYFLGVPEPFDGYAAKMASALIVLRGKDARQYQMVRRYIRRLVVWCGEFSMAKERAGMVLISAHSMASCTDVRLAALLIHEATHLRISQKGIMYEANVRERIERRCTREQADFLRSVGEHAVAVELEAALSRPWWTDEIMESRRSQAYEQLHVSNWGRRLAEFVGALITDQGGGANGRSPGVCTGSTHRGRTAYRAMARRVVASGSRAWFCGLAAGQQVRGRRPPLSRNAGRGLPIHGPPVSHRGRRIRGNRCDADPRAVRVVVRSRDAIICVSQYPIWVDNAFDLSYHRADRSGQVYCESGHGVRAVRGARQRVCGGLRMRFPGSGRHRGHQALDIELGLRPPESAKAGAWRMLTEARRAWRGRRACEPRHVGSRVTANAAREVPDRPMIPPLVAKGSLHVCGPASLPQSRRNVACSATHLHWHSGQWRKD